MGGPGLEIFKFTLYLFVPIAALVHFGDPEWYRNNVVPYRNKLFRLDERTKQTIPTERLAIQEELLRIKNERLERRARVAASAADSIPDSTPCASKAS